MDKMSLFSVLTVSVPEVIFDIYIAFVLTGHRSRLYLDDKLNIVRLLIAVPLLVATEVISRYFIPNLLIVLVVNILIFTTVFRYVYRIKWLDGLIGSIAIFGVLITLEATYVMHFITFINKGMHTLFPNDVTRLIISIPERILQFIIIVSLWNWDVVYISLRSNKKLLLTVAFTAFMLILFEGIFTYTFICNLDKFSILFKVLGTSASLLVAVVNFLLCRVLIMTIRHFDTPI